MLFKRTILLLLTTILATSAYAATPKTLKKNTTKETKEPAVYLLKNTTCRYRKKDHKTYCIDKENKRITGEIRRYQDGKITRIIPVKNGLIHGTVISQDVEGNKIYTKEYKNGIQEGLHETYYKDNKIATSIPYQNGVKEGVAKYYHENGYLHIQCSYVENKMDGEARTYDSSGKQLFSLITANDKIVTGNCNYLNEDNTISTKEIPQIFIDAVNAHCVALGMDLAKNHCSLDKKNQLENCDKTWLKDNIEELREFVKAYEQDNPEQNNNE